MHFDLRKHTHLLMVGGSRAYGLHSDASDVDVKGIAIPPAPYFLGFARRFNQADDRESISVFQPLLTAAEKAVVVRSKLEGSVYDIRKFARLASDANPNLVEILFCRDEEVRHLTDVGRRLRDARQLFLSARAAHTFAGYAMSQLRRIRGHRRWLLEPPKAQPQREDYGLPPRTLIPADQLAAAEAAIRKKLDEWEIDYGDAPKSTVVHIQTQVTKALSEAIGGADERWRSAARLLQMDDNLIAVLDRERRYKAARADWRQYQTWRKNRNPARAELEASFGYDTKHGAHLVRLLRMGREILETGEVHVWRQGRDADELRAIRRGEWSYDALVEWAEAEERGLNALVRAGGLKVPARPEMDRIDALVVELVQATL